MTSRAGLLCAAGALAATVAAGAPATCPAPDRLAVAVDPERNTHADQAFVLRMPATPLAAVERYRLDRAGVLVTSGGAVFPAPGTRLAAAARPGPWAAGTPVALGVLRYDREHTLVLVRTADGGLDARVAAGGERRWRYEPPARAAAGAPATLLRVVRRALRADGRWDPGRGDRALVIVNGGTSGEELYALDVTGPAPRLAWRDGATTLAGGGRLVTPPEVARLGRAVSPDNPRGEVLLLAGGATGPGAGRTVYVLDLYSGRPLGPANGPFAAAVVAAPVAVDLDGDGRLDRYYLVDASGDVSRVEAAGSTRVIAHLGLDEVPVAIDASLETVDGAGAVVLVIAAGGHVFGLRDYDLAPDPGRRPRAMPRPIERRDLIEVAAGATVPAGAAGWQRELPAGERASGAPSTADGTTRFETRDAACRVHLWAVATGSGRANGAPLALPPGAGTLRVVFPPGRGPFEPLRCLAGGLPCGSAGRPGPVRGPWREGTRADAPDRPAPRSR